MSIRSLDKIFHPQSVAVIGASNREKSVGGAIMSNLITGGFHGDIYPINLNGGRIHDYPTYRSIEDLGSPIDLAVIATPIRLVPEIITQCSRADVRGAVIVSAGGKETGHEGAALENDIKRRAEHSGIRIIGPNCLGITCTASSLNAGFAGEMPQKGKMAFVSQSGAICTAILDFSKKENIGFSYFISLGSMLDVDFGDTIDFLGNDPNVSSIVMYIENLSRVRDFMSAARAVSRIKPIIALKAGRTPAGAKAAASHTGALAGDDDVYSAAFKRAGIVRVKTFEELFDCSELLSRVAKPAGPDLAVITNAGGPGVTAADALSDYGVEPATISPKTIEKLDSFLPAHWSRSNPVDILGDATPEVYEQTTSVLLEAPEVGALLIMLAPQAMTEPSRVAEMLVPVLRKAGKPVITVWMGGSAVEEGREIFNRAEIPTFDTPERAVRAFMDLFHYARNIEMLCQIPRKRSSEPAVDKNRVRSIIESAIEQEREILTEIEAKQVLSAYKIPVNTTILASSGDEAAAEAQKIGFPVALKLCSKDFSHKSDVGGVMLNLDSVEDVKIAYENIMNNVYKHDQTANIDGVSVQPMLEKPDHEIIIGSKTVSGFGPVIMFGMGGVLTEIQKDTSLGFPPLNRLLAHRLLEETKIFKVLRGYRNIPPADRDALEEILIQAALLVTDFPEIDAFDINPLFVSESRICAVDARVIVRPSDTRSPLHLIISPYPAEYEETIHIDGVGALLVRPIRPEDAPLLESLFEELSPRSIYNRFFTPLKKLSHSMLARFTQIDYDREIAMVAIRKSFNGHEEEMLGVARIIFEPNGKNAEFSVLTGDPWHGKGIGAHLLKRCLTIAKKRGLDKVYGTVLADNKQMLALGQKLNFNIKRNGLGSEYELTIRF